jgi:hypothetical protein
MHAAYPYAGNAYAEHERLQSTKDAREAAVEAEYQTIYGPFSTAAQALYDVLEQYDNATAVVAARIETLLIDEAERLAERNIRRREQEQGR